MTWDELSAKIAKMSAKQRKQEVKFIERYDDDANIWFPSLLINEGDTITDPSGDRIKPNEFYLA